MVQLIENLAEVASDYDAIILDQWGVLHDGTAPYPGAPDALRMLAAEGTRLAVLSNSGKRAAPNLARIAQMGFPATLFETVMTSGEALWQDCAAGRLSMSRAYPITRADADARIWAEGLDVELVDIEDADAILLMGLPDDTDPAAFDDVLREARARELNLVCSNPDRASPRADGRIVASPGALAATYEQMGGRVIYYGKPHRPVFQALERALDAPPERLLMVGDSPHHDIAGADAAGWDSVLVQGGLHAEKFQTDDIQGAIAALSDQEQTPLPTFSIRYLR